MPLWYLDTSAALKLVIEEPESAALAMAIDGAGAELAACRLLETEMRRAAQRVSGLHQDAVTAFLDTVDIYEMTAPLFRQAGLIPGTMLRSLDALHLAAAISLDVEAIATFDVRLAEASRDAGLAVIRPS
ncbi:type II toxin-antitoxin system VapC family toxin [Sinomonas flava]|uniref:type II toxin-antitoxin system VapC family toxin n=1 Tax=Sinomonas TaxID=596707 RepID=UPI0039A5BCC4